MNTQQIEAILYSHKDSKNYFKGCYPCDSVPNIFNYPASCVVNNDDKYGPGEHWVAIYYENPHKLYYFDSLNIDPNPCLAKNLNKYKKIIKNNARLQSLYSDVCGFYCIFFIIHISRGITFSHIVNHLHKRTDSDTYVKNFVIHGLNE
jgi:hypothetical protein